METFPAGSPSPDACSILQQMVVALDPVSFVRSTPPFDALPEPVFESAAKALEIVFFPAGTRMLTRGGAPSEHL